MMHALRLASLLTILLAGFPAGVAAAQSTHTVYVSAEAGTDAPGQGGELNPYRTISFALAQESDPVENDPPLSIVVAAGTYNAALGEGFPLNVVPGTSILGAETGAIGAGTVVMGSQGGFTPPPLVEVRSSAQVTAGEAVVLRDLEFVTATQVVVDAELASGAQVGLDLLLDGVRFRPNSSGGFALPGHLVDYYVRSGSSQSLAAVEYPAGQLRVRDCVVEAGAASASIRARVLSSRARVLVEDSVVRALNVGLLMTANGVESELDLDVVGTRIADCKTGLFCRGISGGAVSTGILRSNFVGNGTACDQVIDFFTGQVTIVPHGAIEDELDDGSVTHAIQRCIFQFNGLGLCPQFYDLPSFRALDYELVDNVYSIAEPFTAGAGVVASPAFVGESFDTAAIFSGAYDMHLTVDSPARNLGTAPLLPRLVSAGLAWTDADGQSEDDACGDGVADAGLDERRSVVYAFPRLVLGGVNELRIHGEPGRLALAVAARPSVSAPSICPQGPELILPGVFLGSAPVDFLGVARVSVDLTASFDPGWVGIEVPLQAARFDPVTGALDFTPVAVETLHAP